MKPKFVIFTSFILTASLLLASCKPVSSNSSEKMVAGIPKEVPGISFCQKEMNRNIYIFDIPEGDSHLEGTKLMFGSNPDSQIQITRDGRVINADYSVGFDQRAWTSRYFDEGVSNPLVLELPNGLTIAIDGTTIVDADGSETYGISILVQGNNDCAVSESGL